MSFATYGGRSRSILAVGVRASGEWRHASTTTSTGAGQEGAGGARDRRERGAHVTGGGEWHVRRGMSKRRWMGRTAVARGVHVHVQDGADAWCCDRGGGNIWDKDG